MQYYGFQPIEQNGKWYWPKATIKTTFITVLFPLIPLETQIVFNETPGIFSKEFQLIPIKMCWKQVFSILATSYLSITIILILVKFFWV
jgi:hypothetical protein